MHCTLQQAPALSHQWQPQDNNTQSTFRRAYRTNLHCVAGSMQSAMYIHGDYLYVHTRRSRMQYAMYIHDDYLYAYACACSLYLHLAHCASLRPMRILRTICNPTAARHTCITHRNAAYAAHGMRAAVLLDGPQGSHRPLGLPWVLPPCYHNATLGATIVLPLCYHGCYHRATTMLPWVLPQAPHRSQ